MNHSTSPRRADALGVHSVHRFVFSVPDLAEAERFYTAFGLDVQRVGERLDLHTFGHAHGWASVFASGATKQLEYVSFGLYAEDLEPMRERIAARGLACEPHPLSDGTGLWLRNPDGTPWQLVVAPKVSPSEKTRAIAPPTEPPAAARHLRAAGCSRCARATCRTCCSSAPTCRA